MSNLESLLAGNEPSEVRKAVLDYLVKVSDEEASDIRKGHGLSRALDQLEKSTAIEDHLNDLLDLVVQCSSDRIYEDVMRFEVRGLLNQNADLVDQAIDILRQELISSPAHRSVRAARALTQLYIRWTGAKDEILPRLEEHIRDPETGKYLLSLAASQGILEDPADEWIDKYLHSEPNYSSQLGTTILSHGSSKYWRYLLNVFHETKSQSGHASWIAGILLQYGARWPELTPEAEEFCRDFADELWGWTWIIRRSYDSPQITRQWIEFGIRGFSNKQNVMMLSNTIKGFSRPAQLRAILDFRADLWESARIVLREPIVVQTLRDAVTVTTESMHMESALRIATRLALPDLVSWEREALAKDQSRFVTARLAEDCTFWGNSDFISGLSEEMTKEGKENPLYLIDDVAGCLDPSIALPVLLSSDGRFGGDSPLQSYVTALGALAASKRSCRDLERCIKSENEPEWRKRACASAIADSMRIVEDLEVDLALAGSFIADEHNPDWCRDDLAVTVASCEPEFFADLLPTIGETHFKSTRFCLACILAGQKIDTVLRRLEPFKAPVKYPYSANFEVSYAALCVGHLYRKEYISSEQFLEFCRGGLAHEVDDAYRAIDTVRAGDESLLDHLIQKAIEANNSWHSDSRYWSLLGKLAPKRLVSPELLEHVKNCSSHSVFSYTDELLDLDLNPEDATEALEDFLIYISHARERVVSWYAAWAANKLFPSSAGRRIDALCKEGDLAIRSACEHGLWAGYSDEELMQIAKKSKFIRISNYLAELRIIFERQAWAGEYLNTVMSSDNLLENWLYVQAILDVGGEETLFSLRNWKNNTPWSPAVARIWYLRRFLMKHVEAKMKKRRETLFKDWILPGEESFPRWA